jgi:hypothetical protein
MELVAGQPLAGLTPPLPLARAARLVRDLARAAQALHEHGVVHRDIKPQNVRLRPDGSPVLLDLGLAAAADESTLTQAGAVLGTPRYMAPEQARGAEADARTDVYALGLLLHELARGTAARPSGSRADVLRCAATGRIEPGAPLAAAFERVLGKALAREPRRRYASAAELADDLERALAGEPVRGRPPGAAARALDAARREPARAVGGVVLALLAALVAWVAWRADQPSAAERAAAVRHLDHALASWLAGVEGLARHELRALLERDPSDVAGRALDDLLERRPEGTGERERDGLRAALTELAAGGGERASALLAPRLASDAGSRFLEAAAALGLERRGLADEALAARRAACARAPDFGPHHALLAARLLAAGATVEAVEHAARAARLLAVTESAPELVLPRLLEPAPERGPVQVALRAELERAPDDPLVWFALAYSLDSDHQLQAAAEAYARTTALAPDLVRAHLYLAHLYAGAQLGACAQCDAIYAAAPDMLDPARAIAALRAALAADQGAGADVAGRVVQAALDLEKRAPGAAPARSLLRAFEEQLAAAPPGAAARGRLDAGLRRLRAALGGE